MIKLLNEIFLNFQSCFSRTAAFRWFVIIVLGLMLRSDCLGLTSIIRDLALQTRHYESMIHFFHASSWQLESIIQRWAGIVQQFAPLYKEGDAFILIGDGVKQSKEARKMPGVKKLHQESENSAKANYIFGHMFGGIGVLAGAPAKLFCIPLSIRLHDGIQLIQQWEGKQEQAQSHVVQTICQAADIKDTLGKSILLLDRYYLSVPALQALNKRNQSSKTNLQIVTKAKISCRAYQEPEKKVVTRGRPSKKGTGIKLKSLFVEKEAEFTKTAVRLYGKKVNVSYYHTDLLWGTKLYQKLRFVLVNYNGRQEILVSSDLELSPEAIIRLYSYRFKIECTFRELKQVIGGFSYQFWSMAQPKLNRYLKKDAPEPLEQIICPKAQKQIAKTVKAIEGYVQLSCIALGLLQILSLRYSHKVHNGFLRYLRTPSLDFVSEATIAAHLRKAIFRSMAQNKALTITQIIHQKQGDSIFEDNLQAS